MQKRNVLQTSESQISTAQKNGRQKKPIRKKPIRKKKKASIEWGQLFRFAVLLLLVGIIVFHYYLFTEKALVNYYQTIWMNYKHILSPILIIIGYSLIVFLLGYRFGKRKR